MESQKPDEQSPRWLKPSTEYGPLAVFFAAYLLFGLIPATGALIVATLAALAVAWSVERRLPLMPLVTAIIVSIFGGLTIWLEDETFIKMKPTIVQALFAAVLLGGLAVRRPLLKPLLGAAWQMDDTGWRKLTFRFALFFLAMAALNELVWRTQTTDFWVTFKVFGIMTLTVLFAASQVFVLQRHALDREGVVPGDTGPEEG